MKKHFITTALALTIALSSFTGVFAESEPFTGKTDINEKYTFELFQDELKKDLNKDQINKARAAFEKATKLDKKTESIWDELYSLDIYEDYDDYKDEDFEYMEGDVDFDDIKSILRNDLTDKQVKGALELFEQAMNYELKGEIDKADELWNTLDEGDYFKDFEENEVIIGDLNEDDHKFEDVVIDDEGNYIDDMDYTTYEDMYDFNEFAKQFKEGVTSEVKDKVEKIYDEMVKLEKEGKYEEASEKMIKIFEYDVFEKEVNELLDGDINIIIDDDYEMKFEDFALSFKKDISKADLKKARELFDDAIKAEKESIKAWNQLYSMDIFAD